MKKLFIFLICSSLIGCATSITYLRDIPFGEGKRWSQTFDYPYKKVFQASLTSIRSRGNLSIIESSEEKKYIICGRKGVGAGFDGNLWYEVLYFKTPVPSITTVELVYVSSGWVAITYEDQEQREIKMQMFLGIEQQLKLGELKN